jgi:hypothetical protein
VRFLVAKNFDQHAFLSAKVTEATNPHLTILVEPTSTVDVLLEKMVTYHPYRVGVAREQQIENVISQIDLVKFLYKHRNVSEIKIGSRCN